MFKIERKMHGREDLKFLERVFQKLLLNFTWWVNRKDQDGLNVFEGGFLGLDNISPFNRSERLPTGGTMRQADGTGWMGFYCLSMLNIALELAKHNDVYEDIASKFFEHFVFIADAMTFHNGEKIEMSLWNDEEGFYFDAVRTSFLFCLHDKIWSLTISPLIDFVGTRKQQAYPRPQSCRIDSALRDPHARAVGHQKVPRIQEAHGMVHLEPLGRLKAEHREHVARR